MSRPDRPYDQASEVSDATSDFLKAIDREAKRLERAASELDGLWGKGIRHGGVDKRVLDQLRKRSNGIQIQISAVRRLAKGGLN